jgi:hypothetical protein
MFANGPPVKLVSVTRRIPAGDSDAGSGYNASEAGKGGCGVVFASPGTILISIASVAVQV